MKTNRINKLRDWMIEKQVDLSIITSKESVFYFTGFLNDPHERLNALVVTKKEVYFVCPSMEVEDVKNVGFTGPIVGYSDTEDSIELLVHALPSEFTVPVKAVSLELSQLSAERYLRLQEVLNWTNVYSSDEVINILRMKKDEEELSYLREAAALADYAIEVGAKALAEGKTEMDILGLVEYELKKKGINKMSFSTMVLTGANAASPHGVPGKTEIKDGDLVLFDLGVVYKGYCSDITRTIPFGELNEKQREIYTVVLEAQEKALALAKPGVKAKELDLIARNHIADAGYGDYFPHRLGHGLGISVHEYPSLTSTNELILEEGMVLTVEPGIYVPGVAGVRIEDDILITKDGIEVLTKYPKKLV